MGLLFLEEKKILSDFGVNLMLTAGSGTPYSQQSNVTQEAQFGIPIKTTLEGTVNGSRKPWSFRADLKVNKKLIFLWVKLLVMRENCQ